MATKTEKIKPILLNQYESNLFCEVLVCLRKMVNPYEEIYEEEAINVSVIEVYKEYYAYLGFCDANELKSITLTKRQALDLRERYREVHDSLLSDDHVWIYLQFCREISRNENITSFASWEKPKTAKTVEKYLFPAEIFQKKQTIPAAKATKKRPEPSNAALSAVNALANGKNQNTNFRTDNHNLQFE